MEQVQNGADVVLVKGDTGADIRTAYKNYFSDPDDFVRYVERGCQRLMRRKRRWLNKKSLWKFMLGKPSEQQAEAKIAQRLDRALQRAFGLTPTRSFSRELGCHWMARAEEVRASGRQA